MSEKLVKIGDLARTLNILPSTIHFYTQQGLLLYSATTQGGYRLYELTTASRRIKTIQQLQFKKRLTLDEIKKVLK
jgi:DNA-binding transcriptional MerR regulator